MERYKYVFVILVYRNSNDLRACIESIYKHVSDFKIIIVNAYYDDNTMNDVKKIAMDNQCVFFNIENRGYSFGNNFGIKYAKSNYIFDYIIVSNPDIIIKAFPEKISNADIIAPCIISAAGKFQNPMYIKYHRMNDILIYLGFKKKNKFLLYIGLILNKLEEKKERFKYKNKKIFPIYAAHGSFVFLSYDFIKLLGKQEVYDDNIFLFAEEMVLAYKAKLYGAVTIYDDSIVIFHKEDGSMSMGNIIVNEELAKGNIYYYENYIKK